VGRSNVRFYSDACRPERGDVVYYRELADVETAKVLWVDGSIVAIDKPGPHADYLLYWDGRRFERDEQEEE